MSTEIVQILKEDGTLHPGYKPELNKEELLKLYKTMIQTRVYEERSLKLQRSGRIGFYIGCKGQEASHIGSGYALKEEDWVFPAYREPGILFLRGIPVKSLICQMIGNAEDPCLGRQMPCHYSYKSVNYASISSPLATQIPHAVGFAYAAKYKKEKLVTVTYFGEGSTSEGDFHSGLNFAAVFKTPTVFICQNNQWAISVPFHKQTASESIAIKATAYGMPGIKVDGNDVLAMYHVTKEAVERARNGGGPTLIESFTYRLGSHSSSDDAARYRPSGELESWESKDPILRFEIYLTNEGILTAELIKTIRDDAEEEFTVAVRESEKIGQPSLETLFTDVYKEMPEHLKEQMQDLINEQKRLGESADNSMAFPL
ncbi:pyruvate dehydrogenase (acetyl-transferring) E1 component subunit alpha [bacterium]|nr:MAG: pyruvate dehydrogenase (acetyl-transferring) E1 component subunit alpha [bacterium]